MRWRMQCSIGSRILHNIFSTASSILRLILHRILYTSTSSSTVSSTSSSTIYRILYHIFYTASSTASSDIPTASMENIFSDNQQPVGIFSDNWS